jgi:phosphomannomutase
MGVLELPFYQKYFADNFEVVELYCDLDNAYNAHEANPLNTDTLVELQAKVKSENADLGLAYDGDADRIGFIDETGQVIPMDLITGLIAEVLLEKESGATVLYDLRSSRAVKEVIEESGGIAHECRVGHAFIKQQMVQENALFAGELSGHYYFQANKNGEVSSLAAFTLFNLMAKTDKKISELVQNLRRYSHSGEINSEVKDKDAVLAKLKEKYAGGKLTELDGIKIDFPDWWFNVRASNTEPVLRLNCEAKTPEMMEEKRDALLELIRG